MRIGQYFLPILTGFFRMPLLLARCQSHRLHIGLRHCGGCQLSAGNMQLKCSPSMKSCGLVPIPPPTPLRAGYAVATWRGTGHGQGQCCSQSLCKHTVHTHCQGVFRIIKTQGGGGDPSPKSPSPPPQTKVIIVGRTESCKRETLVRPLLVHKLLPPPPPPLHSTDTLPVSGTSPGVSRASQGESGATSGASEASPGVHCPTAHCTNTRSGFH